MMSGYELSDYAFIGNIHQVGYTVLQVKEVILILFMKLIPIEGDVNMQTNPYITVTGTVTSFMLMITHLP